MFAVKVATKYHTMRYCTKILLAHFWAFFVSRHKVKCELIQLLFYYASNYVMMSVSLNHCPHVRFCSGNWSA